MDRRIIFQPYKNYRNFITRDGLKAKKSKGVRQVCGLSPLLVYGRGTSDVKSRTVQGREAYLKAR